MAFCFRLIERTTASKTDLTFTQGEKGSMKTPNDFSNNLNNSTTLTSNNTLMSPQGKKKNENKRAHELLFRSKGFMLESFKGGEDAKEIKEWLCEVLFSVLVQSQESDLSLKLFKTEQNKEQLSQVDYLKELI